MSFYTPPRPVTVRQEVGRYLTTSKELRYLYTNMVGGVHHAAAALSLAACALALFVSLKGRKRVGVLALLLYLVLLPAYGLKDRYLLGSLPAVAILCGAAVNIRWGRPWLRFGICAAALGAPASQLAALPAQLTPHQGSGIQQKAGAALRDIPDDSVLLEGITGVAYYAHRDRQQMTVQSLDLNIRYACKAYPGRSLYVVALESAGETSPSPNGSSQLTIAEGRELVTVTPVTAHCSKVVGSRSARASGRYRLRCS